MNVEEDFKLEICAVITNNDSYCINCEINSPHELNLDITLSESEDVLKNLNNNKSPGIHGLPYEILKNNRHIINRLLCDLFNAIIPTGMHPNTWCAAIISPLQKRTCK